MSERITEHVNTWAQGVSTSASADLLPPGFSPRARNTFISLIGEGQAVMGKRKGALTLNATPITGSPGMIGGFQFKKKSGTKYNLVVSDTGRLDILNADNTTTVVSATAFTSGTHYPAFAVANDLCFIANDVEMKKYDGTTLSSVGITRPVAPTASAAAGGSAATGTWNVYLSYYNSATGQESSRSDATLVTLTAGNQQITVSWLTPSDAQVTHVRVYVQQTAAGANIYRAVAGATPAPDATTGGFPIATLSTTLNISATQYSAFTTLAPSTTENTPPTAGWQFPCWHLSRLFFADSGNLYYSQIRNNTPFPESFDAAANIQPVNPNDGDVITALFSMWGALYIFKKYSVWQLVGSDPNSWNLSLVTRDYGCATARSITAAENVLFWWAGAQGPVAYDGQAQPTPIAQLYVAPTVAYDQVNQLALSSVTAVTDELNKTILWAYPEPGGTRNTKILPFSYRAKRFHAEYWNPFDVYSMFVAETTDRLKAVYFGGYSGQLFQWWAATNDGVPSATTDHGTVTASTNTTLTDSAATFATTGGALVGRYVYAISADRTTIQRRLISANTGTQLTVTLAWDSNPNTTYTYVVGAADWEIDTPWVSSPDLFFYKKRFEFVYVEVGSGDTGVSVDIDLFTSGNSDTPGRTITCALTSMGGIYDTSLYDAAVYGTTTITLKRLRAALTGKNWRVRVRQCQADKDVTLYKVSVQSQVLTTRS